MTSSLQGGGVVHSPLTSALAGQVVGLPFHLAMPRIVPEPVPRRLRLGAAVVVALLIGLLFAFVRGGLAQE